MFQITSATVWSNYNERINGKHYMQISMHVKHFMSINMYCINYTMLD